jgi:hypothetical protein
MSKCITFYLDINLEIMVIACLKQEVERPRHWKRWENEFSSMLKIRRRAVNCI